MKGKVTSDILFVGNISIDKIKNAIGTRYAIGGSVYNAAYCAKIISKKLRIKIYSIVGSDFPLDVLNFLKETGLDTSGIRIIKGKSNFFYIIEEKNKSIIKIKYLKELDNFPCKEKTIHLHVSCRKGIKSPHFYLKTIPHKRASMDLIFSSLKERIKEIEKCLSLVDMVFLNQDEFKILNKYFGHTIESLFPSTIFFITQSEKGIIIKKGEEELNFPGILLNRKKIISTTGAGDAFFGSFLGNYYSSHSPIESLAIAVSAATLSIQDFGVSHISNKLSILKNYYNKLLRQYKKNEFEVSKLFFHEE